jgi:hypothetical protein
MTRTSDVAKSWAIRVEVGKKNAEAEDANMEQA